MFNWERIRGMNLREGERGPGDRGWVAGLRQTGRGNTGHCAGSWVWGSGRWRGWPGSSAWEPSGSFRAERRVSCPCLISSFLSAGWRLLKEEVREREVVYWNWPTRLIKLCRPSIFIYSRRKPRKDLTFSPGVFPVLWPFKQSWVIQESANTEGRRLIDYVRGLDVPLEFSNNWQE